MRIAESKKKSMKTEIMQDLYKSLAQTLSDKKDAIAKKAYGLFMATLSEQLEAVPKNMLNYENSYSIKVKYKQDKDSLSYDIDESWSYYFSDPSPSPSAMNGNNYSNNYRGKLPPELMEEAATLCNALIALNEERSEMQDFLDETLERHSGPKALREAWPESLHKYLPVIAPRKPRVKKADRPVAIEEPAIAVPTALNNRLVTNLLES